MKKILFLLAVFTALFTSCSTDDENTSSVKTASVALTTETASVTGKQVKKPASIPAWVDGFSVKAKSNVYANYEVSDNYTFDQQNGATNIILDNVALGSNTFTASTTTNSAQFYQLTNYTASGNSLDAKFLAGLNNIKADNPYVIYTGLVPNANVTDSNVNLVTIPMTTVYGRILSVFQLNQALKNAGYQAKVTVTITSPVAGSNSALDATTKNDELVTFKWSNLKSVAGAKVTYKVEVSKINSQSTIVKTYTLTQDILASKSISCYYTITDDGIVLKNPNQGLSLSFQDWEEVNCNDCNN